MLAVSIHLGDKSSSYMICFPALQMKASGPALQSDQPCVSPLLPLAGMIFSATWLNDAHCQALWSKQWYKSLCTMGQSSLSRVHCCNDKISERTFKVFSFPCELTQAEHDLRSCCVIKVVQHSKSRVSEGLTTPIIMLEALRDMRDASLSYLCQISET